MDYHRLLLCICGSCRIWRGEERRKYRRCVRIWNGQYVPLDEGLEKGGWKVDFFDCVGQQKICLESRRIPCVEEAVDGGRRRGRNGGSGGGAAVRMMSWAVGGRRSHPFFPLSISRWAATTGRSASAVCIRVATSVRTSVRPMWSCEAGMGGFGRLTSIHCWN